MVEEEDEWPTPDTFKEWIDDKAEADLEWAKNRVAEPPQWDSQKRPRPEEKQYPRKLASPEWGSLPIRVGNRHRTPKVPLPDADVERCPWLMEGTGKKCRCLCGCKRQPSKNQLKCSDCDAKMGPSCCAFSHRLVKRDPTLDAVVTPSRCCLCTRLRLALGSIESPVAEAHLMLVPVYKHEKVGVWNEKEQEWSIWGLELGWHHKTRAADAMGTQTQ